MFLTVLVVFGLFLEGKLMGLAGKGLAGMSMG